MDQAISDKALLEPWRLEQIIVRSLPAVLGEIHDSNQLAKIHSNLTMLADALATLQAQMEDVALAIAANPAFAYRAQEVSADLSLKIAEVGQKFDSLYRELSLQARADAVAAQEPLNSLREILSQKILFDRDVGGAIASGSKNQIQTLAGRWWKGAESIGELRDAILLLSRASRVQPYSNSQDNQR